MYLYNHVCAVADWPWVASALVAGCIGEAHSQFSKCVSFVPSCGIRSNDFHYKHTIALVPLAVITWAPRNGAEGPFGTFQECIQAETIQNVPVTSRQTLRTVQNDRYITAVTTAVT